MRSPVRKSLLRQITWLGGDRRLVGFAGLALAALAWTMVIGVGLLFGLSIVIPGGLFVGILWAARKMAQADPIMIDVVLRQFNYRKYYAPKPDLGTEHPQVRDFS